MRTQIPRQRLPRAVGQRRPASHRKAVSRRGDYVGLHDGGDEVQMLEVDDIRKSDHPYSRRARFRAPQTSTLNRRIEA